jgi:hypothetical protein
MIAFGLTPYVISPENDRRTSYYDRQFVISGGSYRPTARPTDTPTSVPTAIPTASPTVDVQDIIFQDDFSTGQNDWTVGEYSSEWSIGEHTIADGKYRIAVESKQGAARWTYVPELTAKNFALTFDATLVKTVGDFSSLSLTIS